MVGLTQSKSGHGAERIPQLMNGSAVGSNVRNMTNGSRKAVYREQSDALSTPAELHMMPATKVKKQAAEPGEKIAKVLSEDGDPGKLLAEVRDVLFGPTRKLQEARLEELVVILEQLDRETQIAHQGFSEQIKALDSADRQRTLDLAAVEQKSESLAAQHDRELAVINKKIDALSERMSVELQRAAEFHKRELDEQDEVFTSKLERQSAQLLKQMSEMADSHKISVQNLATEFSTQLREMSMLAKTNDDKILSHLEVRVAQVENNIDDDKRRSLKVMIEGLSGLSERLQTL
jgi:hypothetical protein